MIMKYFLPILVIIFISCNSSQNKDSLHDELTLIAMEKGQLIADETQKVLALNLKAVIQRDGISQAIKYCDVNAYPLVDSLKEKYNAEIRRTSLKNRNPTNSPDKKEKQIIEDYQKNIAMGETPIPVVVLDQQDVHFYKPIILNTALCLNCHGEVGKEIKDENYEVIQALYSDDKATDYKLGELRGVWSITFKRDFIKKD